MSASIDTEGTKGSWTWTTSKPPPLSQARTSRLTRGPKASLAIEPLYGIEMADPVGVR